MKSSRRGFLQLLGIGAAVPLLPTKAAAEPPKQEFWEVDFKRGMKPMFPPKRKGMRVFPDTPYEARPSGMKVTVYGDQPEFYWQRRSRARKRNV